MDHISTFRFHLRDIMYSVAWTKQAIDCHNITHRAPIAEASRISLPARLSDAYCTGACIRWDTVLVWLNTHAGLVCGVTLSSLSDICSRYLHITVHKHWGTHDQAVKFRL